MMRYVIMILLALGMLLQGEARAAAIPPEPDSPPVAAYKRFANAFIYGELKLAHALAQGKAQEVVEKKRALVEKGLKIPKVKEPMFMIIGEKLHNKGNKADVHAMQIVQPDTGKSFEPRALHRQVVTLIKNSQGQWIVTKFHDDLEKCCDE
ncbi:MAG: hypothetical protein HQL53_01605 [Magnetococcales bacterium]|nr:hypothetical protein [Magnetococcales bacterium]